MGFIWSRNHAIVGRGVFPLKNRHPLIYFQCQRFSSVWMTAIYSHYTDWKAIMGRGKLENDAKADIFWQLDAMHLNLWMKDCDMASAQPKSPFSGKNVLKTYLQKSIKKRIKNDWCIFTGTGASRNLSLSSSAIPINGAGPLGFSCRVQ